MSERMDGWMEDYRRKQIGAVVRGSSNHMIRQQTEGKGLGTRTFTSDCGSCKVGEIVRER